MLRSPLVHRGNLIIVDIFRLHTEEPLSEACERIEFFLNRGEVGLSAVIFSLLGKRNIVSTPAFSIGSSMLRPHPEIFDTRMPSASQFWEARQ